MTIDREALRRKYMLSDGRDEEVLVVPLSLVREIQLENFSYTPATPTTMLSIISVLESKSYYIPRYYSDYNPEEVEIIPYVSIMNENSLFLYKRIKNGDARGDGKFSVGIGGHINPVDSIVAPYGTIERSARREFYEEVGIKAQNLTPAGVIRCLESDYDRDHLGIHFVVPANVFKVAEVEKMLPFGMITPQAIRAEFYNRLENWSKIVVDNMD